MSRTQMNRAARQEIIRSVIRNFDITTLRELQEALEREGAPCALPTLSRDVADLGIVKLGGRYSLAADLADEAETEPLRLSHLRQFIVSFEAVGSFVAVRTRPGAANTVAVQLEAQSEVLNMAGCIAGDDTIFILLRDDKAARRTIGWLESITG
jgi:transcriptional regulator of arginine metabolism